jgi:glycosyltransferase involved in cell wall biosynthesis
MSFDAKTAAKKVNYKGRHRGDCEFKRRTMRILMANYEFPPIGGGAGKANLCLLKQYAGKDELVIDVLTSAPKPGFTTEKFADNITIYKVGLHKKNLHFWRKGEVVEWLFKASRHYRRLAEANDYNLAHAFFAFPTAYFCLRSARKLPYIISLRGSDVPGYNVRLQVDYKLLAPLFRRIWKSAAAIVANSKGLAELAGKFMPDLDIGVINNGVDTEIFYAGPAKSITQPVKVLTVCRLISRKRIELLIESVARAKALGVDIQLDIAGEGNLTAELKRLTEKVGVATCVNFLGRISTDKMPALYRDNDIFIMSSAHEGMSNAMLEAMACGLPIVTTRCEGVDELIGDNGIVVEHPSPDSMAEAIKSLADDPVRYEKMRDASVSRAKQFTWSRVANQYLECYQTVINNRSRTNE